MILLVGGTSESPRMADLLLREGHRVLVSLATEIELDLPVHPRLSVRRGRLDRSGFQALIRDLAIDRVVDASHPFAVALRQELTAACEETGTRRIRYERPEIDLPPWIEMKDNHREAASSAFGSGRPVLLTTGSRNLSPYAHEAVRTDTPLFARILPGEESRHACRAAGLPEDRIEFARGPFSAEQTRTLIRRWRIGVMVAKDGGGPSGLVERMEAAKAEGVRMVVVRRPGSAPGSVDTFHDVLVALGSS